MGANAKLCFPYCMISKEKQKGGNGFQWKSDIRKCNIGIAPNRDRKDEKWDPILPMMLDKVHICTFHDEMRIIDKCLHLHTFYAYNLKNKEK